MGSHKTFNFEDRGKFLGKSLKELPRKWKLHNLNYKHITLKLCKRYAYSEYISSLWLWICKLTIYTNVLNGLSENKLVGLGGSILAVFLLYFMYFAA